jgi:phosphate:Na+ symporter
MGPDKAFSGEDREVKGRDGLDQLRREDVMEDLADVREQLNEMGRITLSMLRQTFAGFMEHNRDMLAEVLVKEQQLNDAERAIATYFAGITKTKISAAQKKNIMRIASIALELEQAGDYIKDMVERIEIKIEEKLLFDDAAVDEYKRLYKAVELELAATVKALETSDKKLAQRVLEHEDYIDKLVKRFGGSHTKRLLAGACEPRSCNMFLNLLDFTAQISRHTKAVARSILTSK